MVKKFAMTLPLQRTELEGLPHIPILRIRDWFHFFLRNNCIHILHGLRQAHAIREKAILAAFWRNFIKLYPNHQISQQVADGGIDLQRALPLLLHGDEGRGRRHAAHFVCSFHSILGKGFQKMKTKRTWAKMECNFEGHTYTNRFLMATLRKKDYGDPECGTWDKLMQTIADECRFMWETGVANPEGERYWGIIVGIVGDWPFLHKSAGFLRSFNNIQKRVTVRKPPTGICHLCQAGQLHAPFEQVATRRPEWLATQHLENPFASPSPFVTNVLHEPGHGASLWVFDWFHTMHLGVLKCFLGSVLVLLTYQEDYSSVDDRFQSLTEKFHAWCQQHKQRAHFLKLTKESLGWDTTYKFPQGTWHKGSASTVLMKYIEYRLTTEVFPDEPLLGLCCEATTAIQRLSRFLYRSSLWLEPSECQIAAELGFRFLRRYAELATRSKAAGKCLFVFQPKLHCLHHFVLELHSASQRNLKGINPLGTSCQPSEDFIGRPSRLARRVTAQNPVLHRIMDRYLQASYHLFLKERYLIRSWFLGRWRSYQQNNITSKLSFHIFVYGQSPPGFRQGSHQ